MSDTIGIAALLICVLLWFSPGEVGEKTATLINAFHAGLKTCEPATPEPKVPTEEPS